MSIDLDRPVPTTSPRIKRLPLRDSRATKPPVLISTRREPRVALITEGTYPFSGGGVSTWCDQLMTTLPEVGFEVVSITATGGNQRVWQTPPNVNAVTELGFWEPSAPGERARYMRAMGRGRIDATALESVMRLLDLLLDPRPDQEAFERSLDELITQAELEHLAPALRCRAAVRWLTKRLAEIGWKASIADVVQCLDILEHLMRPAGFRMPTADIYHATGNGLAALVAIAGSARTGAPIVLSEHGVYLRERYLEYLDGPLGPCTRTMVLRFYRLLAATAYRRADVIVPVTSYNRRWEVHNGADEHRIRVVNNGVDPARFSTGSAEGSNEGPPTVGFLSRIDRIKDPLTLIRSAVHVKAEIPDVRVRIWGAVANNQQDYDLECRRTVSDLGLDDTVSFEGVTDDPASAYGAMDVLVSTSISEGLPYGIIEAMMCRKAIISTNVGGLPEALDGVAVLIEPRDADTLARAIVDVLHDPETSRELGTAARERALERFSLVDMTERYRAIYADAVRTVDLRRSVTTVVPGRSGGEQ